MTAPAPLAAAARAAAVVGQVLAGLAGALLAARCPNREARHG